MAVANQELAPRHINVIIKTPDSVEETVVVRPPVVKKVNAILPLNTQTTMGTGGRTFVNTNGDLNYRVTIDGYLFQTQLDTLKEELLTQYDTVKVISASFTGLVNFDRFEHTRHVKEAEADNGEDMEAFYSFQLQNKQNTNKSFGQQVVNQ